MDFTLLAQRIVDGLENGAIYAALALALVLIFQVTGLLNFAQSEMAMFSTFGTWALTDAGLPVWLSIVVSMIVSFVGGALIERIVIRPVEGKSPLAIVIVTIGLFLTINALAGYFWSTDSKVMPTPWPSKVFDLGGVKVTSQFVGTLTVLIAVVIVLTLLLSRTRLGLALRAVASSPESSRLVGISVGSMLMIGWGLAAAIGALAGALVAPKTFVDPNMMQGVAIYSFAAATLGGFDSLKGAVIGGLIVGLVESLASGYLDIIGSDLKLATAFLVILFVLVVKPAGLFGRAKVQRV